jgi:hypothetical protein
MFKPEARRGCGYFYDVNNLLISFAVIPLLFAVISPVKTKKMPASAFRSDESLWLYPNAANIQNAKSRRADKEDAYYVIDVIIASVVNVFVSSRTPRRRSSGQRQS